METYKLELAEKEAGNKIQFSSKYPNNINIKDFVHFMLHPVFVYQDTYPIAEKRQIKTIFARLAIICLSFVISSQCFN